MTLYSETMFLYSESIIYKVRLQMSLYSEEVFLYSELIIQSDSANVSVQ